MGAICNRRSQLSFSLQTISPVWPKKAESFGASSLGAHCADICQRRAAGGKSA
jgi:hypothetical protein